MKLVRGHRRRGALSRVVAIPSTRRSGSDSGSLVLASPWCCFASPWTSCGERQRFGGTHHSGSPFAQIFSLSAAAPRLTSQSPAVPNHGIVGLPVCCGVYCNRLSIFPRPGFAQVTPVMLDALWDLPGRAGVVDPGLCAITFLCGSSTTFVYYGAGFADAEAYRCWRLTG